MIAQPSVSLPEVQLRPCKPFVQGISNDTGNDHCVDNGNVSYHVHSLPFVEKNSASKTTYESSVILPTQAARIQLVTSAKKPKVENNTLKLTVNIVA